MTETKGELKKDLKRINKIISKLTKRSQKMISSEEEKNLWAKKREILAKLNPINND